MTNKTIKTIMTKLTKEEFVSLIEAIENDIDGKLPDKMRNILRCPKYPPDIEKLIKEVDQYEAWTPECFYFDIGYNNSGELTIVFITKWDYLDDSYNNVLEGYHNIHEIIPDFVNDCMEDYVDGFAYLEKGTEPKKIREELKKAGIEEKRGFYNDIAEWCDNGFK